MKQNVGSPDRIIRAIIALAFIALYLTGAVAGTMSIVLLVLGGILLLTAIVGFCPLYALLRINTMGHKPKTQQ